MRSHESVGPLLRVLTRLFVVFHVMAQHLHGLLERYVEGMGSAGIDDDLEIGFARERPSARRRCPVVFLAN
jgi:hypothetical protein